MAGRFEFKIYRDAERVEEFRVDSRPWVAFDEYVEPAGWDQFVIKDFETDKISWYSRRRCEPILDPQDIVPCTVDQFLEDLADDTATRLEREVLSQS